MSKVTLVEIPTIGYGKVRVKPFFDPNRENLGLEKYGLSLFDGVAHEEQLACIEQNGVRRYLTGLNPFAPEVKMIPDKKVREAKIKEINKVVAQLERELNANHVDPEDEDMWKKVVLLQPNNDEFWNKIFLRCSNQEVALDPERNAFDLIKLYAIEAGGFSIVAKSYEDARSRPVPPKFYLDKDIVTITTKTEIKKLKNKALALLEELYNTNASKLLYVAKVVDSNSSQYKKSTPNDIIYDNMDKYILGEGSEPSVKRSAQSFIDAAELDLETLKLRSLIKDATFYKFIATKSDGFIYHISSATMMGRNASDCLEFLKNPLNDKVLGDLLDQVEPYWNK
jgi:DNA-binding winged helix-turn-helix (wHTH) protein